MLGAINVLGLSRRTGARSLLASTSEVYGDPSVHPQKEDYWGNVNPIGIRSCYDEGKRCAEALYFDYHRRHRLAIKVVRIFNTYGPRMHPKDGRVVSNFIVQALKGEPITIYGDGTQTRSFCYVDDLIDGLVRMMDTPVDFLGPVNLGSPGEFTMLELAELVLRVTGSRSRLVREPLPQDDPKRRRPDHFAAFAYVGESMSDLADAHVRALQWLENGGACCALNLGTGRGHSVREVIATVERVSGHRVAARNAPRRPGDPPELVALPSRAWDQLGWRPARSGLESIVRTAHAWHEKRVSAPRQEGAAVAAAGQRRAR